MKNVERRDRQLPYISDAEVMEQQMNARRLTQKLNTIDRSDFDGIAAIVKELFGKSEGAFVNPPFYCDYGFHIEVGKNFFANYNCTILDVAKVKIGDNCQMAPNVASILQVIRCIRRQETVRMNTALKLPSEIMSGLAEIPLFYQVYISEITLLSAAEVL